MTKKIIHIILAIVAFLSSTGIFVNQHFCQQAFMGSGLIPNFGTCCEGADSDSCSAETISCDHTEDDHDDKGCCDHKVKFFKLEQTQEIQKTGFKSFDFFKKINALYLSFFTLESNHSPYNFNPKNYAPPFIVYDRCVRLQSFLC